MRVIIAMIKRDFHCFFVCRGRGIDVADGILIFNCFFVPTRWKKISCEKCGKVFYKREETEDVQR